MSTALTAPAASQWESREMIDTLKQTVCKGASDAQFKMFLEVCKGTGLNPFLKEIWYIPNVGVMAGRDGYLRVANEHPQFDGMETRVERDEQGIPVKAICSVWRKDRSHPITCEAFYNEYKKSGNVWSTYPSAMIAKVAEVLALKRSFSINGVVTEEEIGEQKQSAKDARVAVAKARIEELKQIPAGSTISPAELADTEPEATFTMTVNGPVTAVPPDYGYEEREAKRNTEAAEALKGEKPLARKRGAVAFDALKHFGEMKKAMRVVTGTDADYYRVLKGAGYDHADEIRDTEEARRIYKLLGLENNRLRADAELTNLLKESREQIGGVHFMDILGAHGCDGLPMVLEMAGEPLEALLKELKQTVDDTREKQNAS